MNIDMERRAIRCGENRRLVVETEVVAQPDDIAVHADGLPVIAPSARSPSPISWGRIKPPPLIPPTRSGGGGLSA